MNFKKFLKENVENHAVLAFGRLNPITSGHESLINTVKKLADKVGGSHHIVLSHSTDPGKNPLTGTQKLRHAKRAFPGTNFSVSTKEHPNFLKQAELLHKKGVTHLHMVGGSDRVEEFRNLLHKYNGIHKGALFNFKNIEVHSAGDRDPDAEGVSGISASKMRDFAAKNDYKKFKKGVPSTMKDEHAKAMFNDVRKGMGIKEDIDLGFEMLLNEGVHDKGIFKAVFLAGGPGSGKDFVLSKTLDGHGMVEINSDKALEYLMDKESLDKRMPKREEKRRNEVRKRAKNVTEMRERLALEGRNGVIINGTGDDPDKISRIKGRLEALGYETKMIMVNTADEVSRDRNVERGQRGGRTVPEEIRKQKWDEVQAARASFAELFKDNYVEFDNSTDLRTSDDSTRDAKQKELDGIFKEIQKFVSAPPKNNAAKEWVAQELNKKDTLPLSKPNSSMPHEGSKAAEKAREMGLDYYGFGRYGKNGKVAYRSVHDKLVDVKSIKPLKEQYTLSDNDAVRMLLLGTDMEIVDLDESSKDKYLTDSKGKLLVFKIRGSAAKEAHQKGGVVIPHEKGYVVKLKESQNDYHVFEKFIRSESRSSRIETGTSSGLLIETADCGGATNASKQSDGKRKGTLTLKEIYDKKDKEVKESIDKGIEPGLSMATSGENMMRGAIRNKAVKKPLEELTGDETTASIGDQKEDELKKSGISLKSFKKRNYI